MKLREAIAALTKRSLFKQVMDDFPDVTTLLALRDWLLDNDDDIADKVTAALDGQHDNWKSSTLHINSFFAFDNDGNEYEFLGNHISHRHRTTSGSRGTTVNLDVAKITDEELLDALIVLAARFYHSASYTTAGLDVPINTKTWQVTKAGRTQADEWLKNKSESVSRRALHGFLRNIVDLEKASRAFHRTARPRYNTRRELERFLEFNGSIYWDFEVPKRVLPNIQTTPFFRELAARMFRILNTLPDGMGDERVISRLTLIANYLAGHVGKEALVNL